MLKKSTTLKIKTVLLSAEAFTQHNAVAMALAELLTSTADLATLGLRPEELQGRLPVAGIVSPLTLAMHSEQLHADLLAEDERSAGTFYGSAFEVAMGNLAMALCDLAGLDVEQADADGYCLKATATEICQFNIQTIAQQLAEPCRA